MLGVVTIAQGAKKYIDMSKMLAVSLMLSNPAIKRAVVTDAPQEEFEGLFDIYIPYNAAYGNGLSQKLNLDKYTPFEETLFIDSDCLVLNSLNPMIELCRKHPFVVFGGQISSGEWYMDVDAMCKKFDLPSIPLFNGGTYYFNNSEIATNIYAQARLLSENYDTLGFKRIGHSVNEEPLIAVAMALNNIEATDDKGTAMRTPIGIEGPFTIDVLNKKCAFEKSGEYVEPVIVHFSGSHANAFHYKREVRKLKTVQKAPFLNRHLVSSVINLCYNTPYASFVFLKRIVKAIIRKEKFDFKNTLPVFSNM
jgi:hypothetical protein